MIDIHTHILPGIDDGAPDFEETLRMARRAWRDGIRDMIATPHRWWDDRENGWDMVQALSMEITERLSETDAPIRVTPGTEVPTRPEVLDLLHAGRLPTLGSSRYILLEPPFTGIPPGMKGFVEAILGAGYQIVLAHPERCRTLQSEPESLDDFLPREMAIQVTSHSILGMFGEPARIAAMALLRSGRPIVIASDTHNSTRRPPELRQAVGIAATVVGAPYAEETVTSLPRALLEDARVWPPPGAGRP